MKTKTRNNLIDWLIFSILASFCTIVFAPFLLHSIHPLVTALLGAVVGLICMIFSITIRKLLFADGELQIIRGNKTPFLRKLGWRLLFKKVKQPNGIVEGRCIKCDANGNHMNINLACSNFYCPCKWNEQLKLK